MYSLPRLTGGNLAARANRPPGAKEALARISSEVRPATLAFDEMTPHAPHHPPAARRQERTTKGRTSYAGTTSIERSLHVAEWLIGATVRCRAASAGRAGGPPPKGGKTTNVRFLRNSVSVPSRETGTSPAAQTSNSR